MAAAAPALDAGAASATAAAAAAAAAVEKPAPVAPGLTVDGRPIWEPRTLTWAYKLLFSHLGRLVVTGYWRRLEPSDLYAASELDTVKLHARFEREWTRQRALPGGGSLFRALAPGSGPVLALTAAMHAVGLACQFAQPLILQQIVDALACVATPTKGCPTKSELYPFAGYLAASTVVYNVLSSHERILLTTLGLRTRGSVMAAIYRKTLLLSSGAAQEESAGRIVTLMSNDAQKLQEFLPMVHEVWAAPCLIAASVWLLYSVLSWSTFVGLAVVFLLLPCTAALAGRLFVLRRGLVALADKRVNLLSEMVGGIRVIKFYTWEASFAQRVTAIRLLEVAQLWRISKLTALFGVLLFSAPVLIGVAAIGSYSLAGGPLTAGRLYTALATFNLIRFPLVFLPFIVVQLLNAKVALERLTVFLTAEEAEPAEDPAADGALPRGAVRVTGPASFHYPVPRPKPDEGKGAKGKGAKGGGGGGGGAHQPPAAAPEPAAAAVPEGAVAVDPSPPPTPFALTNVALDIAPGSLVMVIGPVGSGKSTLLAALNRYLVRDGGAVALGGTRALAAQTAWVLGATVEANVLFGAPMEPKRYAAALAAAQLGPDLAALPFGDQARGGQKQRVSLARLAYARADVNLLDDPLSAVDAHVGAALFDHLLCGSLKGTTRVLVTNALQYLPSADLVVVMEKGAMVEAGTYDALRAKGTDFDALCATHAVAAEEEAGGEGEGGDGVGALAGGGGSGGGGSERRVPSLDGGSRRGPSLDGGSRRGPSLDGGKSRPPPPPQQPAHADAGNLTGVESRTAGRVSWATYAAYARAARSNLLLVMVLLAFCLEYGTKSFLDAWLGFWTADRVGWTAAGTTHYYLVVYVALFLANALATYNRSLTFYTFAVRASRTLHATLLAKVLRLPQAFFDTTPSGRVVNRFSRDTEVLDTLLPTSAVQAIGCFFAILTALLIVTIANVIFLAVLVPVVVAYVLLQRFYIPCCVELQRIESTTRSPIYTALGEAVQGVATLRAFGRGPHFVASSDADIGLNGRAILTQRLAAEWLNVRLRFLSAAVSTVAALLVISGGVPPALAGLTLVYVLQVPQYMEHGTAQASDAESKMNSVERMGEYGSLPEEAPAEDPPPRPPPAPPPPAPDWPSDGRLEVTDLVLRYRPDLPQVLRGVSFAVASGEKVGIVGRTGSGKSSLLLALFRLVEPEAGRVTVAGADTRALGLRRLRRALAMIPQDPFLYSGSLRDNLDPFAEASDAAVWEALERVGLRGLAESDPRGLGLDVSDGGSNLSLGQRQLLCMARALLRPGLRFLCMDEATASVDLDSDALLQRTVRDAFKGVTVLTIAHRLNTVMDSDRVLVLDGGKVAEFGPPHELLANPSGALSALVDQTGRRNAEHLRGMAADAAGARDGAGAVAGAGAGAGAAGGGAAEGGGAAAAAEGVAAAGGEEGGAGGGGA